MSGCAAAPDLGGPVIGGEPEQTLMPRKRKVTNKGVCAKCKDKKAKLARMSLGFCRECFERANYGRIVKSLHPALHQTGSDPKNPRWLLRPATQAGDVIFALSGGAGSMMLLDTLVKEGYFGAKVKKAQGVDPVEQEDERNSGVKWPVWKTCWVVYIEYRSAIGQQMKAPERTESMRSLVESYGIEGFRFVGLKVEDAFDDTLPARLKGLDNPEIAERLQAYLRLDDTTLPLHLRSSDDLSPTERLHKSLSLLPPSSHPHFLSQIRDSLLNIAAFNLPHISHILNGETSTRSAQNVIASTAIGKGWSLPFDLAPKFEINPRGIVMDATEDRSDQIAESSTRPRITRLKPLRDITVKDAAYYCQANKLPQVNWRRWDSFTDGESGKTRQKFGSAEARGKHGINSLERLTEDFINGLLATHPSTVSTISRTAYKLVFKGEDQDKNRICPLCSLPAERSSLDWKSRTALLQLPNRTSASTSNAESGRDNPLKSAHHANSLLAKDLCYACLTTLSPLAIHKASSGAAADNASPPEIPMPTWLADSIDDEDARV